MEYRSRIDKVLQTADRFTDTKGKVYVIGLIITLFITLKEVHAVSFNNFQIFSFGCLDFWSGKDPYLNWSHLSLLGEPLDLYLYGPLFSILFTPFAMLPHWLGPYCWNVFSYSLFFISVFTLPERFNFKQKRFIFLYTSLLLFASLLSMQFNPAVAALFLFSFTLLERNQGFWAVLLILVSGFAKIYGIFQLAMILFYPGWIKRSLYAVFISVVLVLLPAVNMPLNHLWPYYQNWFGVLAGHLEGFRNYSIFRILQLFDIQALKTPVVLSVTVYLLMVSAAVIRLKSFRDSFNRRAMFLGLIMGWTILFSMGSEKHTYIIAIAGYSIWYLAITRNNQDKILLWINFILLGIVPIDIVCPVVISDFLLGKMVLNVIVFAITWGIMVYRTFLPDPESITPSEGGP